MAVACAIPRAVRRVILDRSRIQDNTSIASYCVNNKEKRVIIYCILNGRMISTTP
jgi:hypothetical protein